MGMRKFLTRMREQSLQTNSSSNYVSWLHDGACTKIIAANSIKQIQDNSVIDRRQV